ncbi:glutathione peroxidase [Hyphomonas sp. CACIAM 19H1]|nr:MULTISPECIES: glutathione peroxidase [Hyphomonas]AXE65468.1 glutathione peroxidase [Hyphomonas sp. CACIAM 19H1]
MRLAMLALATPVLLAACSEATAGPKEDAPTPPAAQETGIAMSATEFTSIDGKPLNLTGLNAKAILVVNTASRCGYTPQYAGLQELYEANKADGLVIVGVPSNDFGGQEPGSEEDVKSFCEINYGVTFPLTKKYAVTGPDQHPFYKAAVTTLGEPAQPKWNFHKILVRADGTPIKAYPSSVKPGDKALAADIEAALGS